MGQIVSAADKDFVTPRYHARPLPGERAGLLAISAPTTSDGYAVIEVRTPSGQLHEAPIICFAALQRLDAQRLDHLYALPCEEHGLGLTIMDRLRRCAAPDQPWAFGGGASHHGHGHRPFQ